MLKKEHRLKKASEFKEIFDKNKKKVYKHIIIYYQKSQTTKLGVITKKKIGNAVIRNKWKRRIKSIYKEMSQNIKNHDIIIITKTNINNTTFSTVKKTVLEFTKKL